MSWSILKADPEYITIKLNFTDETAVSTNSHDMDMITVKILQPELFVGANSQKKIVINEK